MVFRNLLKGLLLCAVMLVGLSAAATVPVSGNYYIKNVHLDKYVKVTGAYQAEPNATSKADASNIRVGVVGVMDDGTYKMNSLASTYGENNTPVEVYDYVGKAITIGSELVKKQLEGKEVDGQKITDEQVKKAIQVMSDFVSTHAYMRIKPVEGKPDTYLAVATIPSMKNDPNGSQALDAMVKVGVITEATDAAAWRYLRDLVYKYAEGNVSDEMYQFLQRNLEKIDLGVTYLLGADDASTFDFTAVDPNKIVAPSDWFEWKMTPASATGETLAGVYKIHNIGQDKWVKMTGKYYAKPNFTETEATDVHIATAGTIDPLQEGQVATKVTSLGCDFEGTHIEVSDYLDRAISIGQALAKKIMTDGNGTVAPDSDVNKAADYIANFVHQHGYMVLEPVKGTDYVYAYATIPDVPDNIKDQIIKYGKDRGEAKAPKSREEVWGYLQGLVKYYLNKSDNQTDGTLKSMVLNNIDKIFPKTYFLTAESDGTFGYVAREDADLQNKDLWWGIDMVSADTKVESGIYKIRNVALGTYVNVEDRYYARPNVKVEDATPIHVGLNAQNADGSYDLNSLAGQSDKGAYIEVYDYVDKAISIGQSLAEKIMTDPGKNVAPAEDVQKAKDYIASFVKKYAYMSIRPVAGQSNTWYAYATIPDVPDNIKAQIVKYGKERKNETITVPAPANEDSVWSYLQGLVKYYLTKGDNNTDSKLKSMVLNHIDELLPNHTYYLTGDNDGTFGMVDAKDANYADNHLWWNLETPASLADLVPISGYYRMRNAAGVGGMGYANVTDHFIANPNLTPEQAMTAAGSVIYLATDSTTDGISMPVTRLRSQGISAVEYLEGIGLCWRNICYAMGVGFEQITKQSTKESIKGLNKYAPMLRDMIMSRCKEVDWHVYLQPTYTSDGHKAYFMMQHAPDIDGVLGDLRMGLDVMGKTKQQLVDLVASKLIDMLASQNGNLKTYFMLYNVHDYQSLHDFIYNKDVRLDPDGLKAKGTTGTMDYAPYAAMRVIHLVDLIDQPDAFWDEFVENVYFILSVPNFVDNDSTVTDNVVFNLFSGGEDGTGNKTSDGGLPVFPKQALNLVRIKMRQVHNAGTYCITSNANGITDIADVALCADNDSAKWVLEPFDENDPAYDANAYNYVGVKTDTIMAGGAYYGTGYFDFDAKIEPVDGQKPEVLIVTKKPLRHIVGRHEDTYDLASWQVELTKVNADTIPAHTAVLLRSTMKPGDKPNIALKPVGTPTTSPVESDKEFAWSTQGWGMCQTAKGAGTDVWGLFYYVGSKANISWQDILGCALPEIQGYIDESVVIDPFTKPTYDDTPDARFAGNLLKGSLLKTTNLGATNHYWLELKPGKSMEVEELDSIVARKKADGWAAPIRLLNMEGLGFWRNYNFTLVEANQVYLYAENFESGAEKQGWSDYYDQDYQHRYFGENANFAPGYLIIAPPVETTLRQLTAVSKGFDYSVVGNSVMAVDHFTTASGEKYLVVTDTDEAAVNYVAPDAINGEQIKVGEFHDKSESDAATKQKDYGQHNWALVKVKTEEEYNMVGVPIDTITGKLTSSFNPTIEATAVVSSATVKDVTGETSVALNTYCPANFMTSASNVTVSDKDGKDYFFMPPKPCELATLVWAIAKDGKLYMPADDKYNKQAIKGAVSVNWGFNGKDVTLTDGNSYKMKVVILRNEATTPAAGSRKRAKSGNTALTTDNPLSTLYTAYPIEVADAESVVTNVSDVNGAKEVESITYFNLAGQASTEPYEGVNIVVTRFTDGSQSATKQLK